MHAATALTDAKDAKVAARQLASSVRRKLADVPGALVLFAAPTFDHQKLLKGLNEEFPSAIIVGASSAGEFTDEHVGEDATCLLALGGPDVRFGSGIIRNLKADVPDAARQLSAAFRGPPKPNSRTAQLGNGRRVGWSCRHPC